MNDTHEPTGARLTDEQVKRIAVRAAANPIDQYKSPFVAQAMLDLRALLADRARQDERIAALEGENARLREQAAKAERLAHQLEADLHYERHTAHVYQDENARMRPLVEAIANYHTTAVDFGQCKFCKGLAVYHGISPNTEEHTPDCPVTKARALVAQWQTPAAPDAPTPEPTEGSKG